jgi:anaerobic ribonucleoside-triphosphate reductase activating protein
MFIAGIERGNIVDGEGWRIAIFFQGCNHKCIGCHNEETHEFNVGKEYSVDELVEEIKKAMEENKLYEGITLSGGDPFFQAKEAAELCERLRDLDIDIWAYTGFSFDSFIDFKLDKEADRRINSDMINLLNYIDVLVDGRFIECEKTIEKQFRGSSNQRLIDVKASLLNNKAIEYSLEF